MGVAGAALIDLENWEEAVLHLGIWGAQSN